jgi:hypothetical protein
METEQINEKAKERAKQIINLATDPDIFGEYSISISSRIDIAIASFKISVLEDLEEDILCIAGDIDHISEAIAEGLEKIGKEIYWKNTN